MGVWHWHPSVLIGLAGLLVLYARGARRHATGPQIAAFLAGSAALAAAVLGPLAEWAEHRALSAHMAQHLVLTLVVAPLWLVGTPTPLLGPLVRNPGLRLAGRALTRPAVAFGLSAAVLVVWHRPVFYEAALRHDAVHVLEHATLLGTALLAWWPVAGPAVPEWPRLAPPARLLYLFLSTVPMMVVAAPITLADQLLYPFYGEPAAAWPLSPRSDQELAGLLMWLVGPIAYLLAGTLIFFRWARGEELEVAVGGEEERGPA